MRSRLRLNIFVGTRLAGVAFFACGLLAVCLACPVLAQTGTPPVAVVAGEQWASLTAQQKACLAPLEKTWSSLSEGQRRKWLAVSETYPSLGLAEQEKLHSRMAEWAALSPKEREAARLNFAQSKTLAKSDRAANWEAYQALSPQERDALARGAKPNPVGAAVAVKPIAPDKLTAVPVTRHSPEHERAAAVQQRPIDHHTLLPLPPASASASAPAKP